MSEHPVDAAHGCPLCGYTTLVFEDPAPLCPNGCPDRERDEWLFDIAKDWGATVGKVIYDKFDYPTDGYRIRLVSICCSDHYEPQLSKWEDKPDPRLPGVDGPRGDSDV